jgi:CheY-like chemotaxis protein
LRILIVDDDPAVVDTLADLIKPLGHAVVGVTDGYAALDRFRRDRYDLVIVDVVMPEMNGVEVIRKVRAIDQTVRIVALTGTGLDFTDILPPVGIRFVHKPIGTPASIVDLITAP